MLKINSGYNIALSSEQLISQEIINNQIDQIQSLVSLPKKHFDLFYLNPIKHFLSYMQYYGQEPLQERLETVIATLKIRRSYILPIDTPSEQINKVKDLWTYTVFTSSLMYNANTFIDKDVIYKFSPTQTTKKSILSNPIFKKHQYRTTGKLVIASYINPVLLTYIFDKNCLAWLSQDYEALTTVLKLITNIQEPTQIDTILHQCFRNAQSEENLNSVMEDNAKYLKTNINKKPTSTSNNLNSDLSLNFLTWLQKNKDSSKSDLLNQSKTDTSSGIAFLIPDVFKAYASYNNGDYTEVQNIFTSEPNNNQYIQTITLPIKGKVNVILL